MDYKKAQEILEKALEDYSSFQPGKLTEQLQLSIRTIMSGTHLTFRYMCFTALLAKVCDPSIHPRSVQRKANLNGAYDARSLCHKVIVPFEKSKMEGRLGDSNEPYLNKPARCLSIEKTNPVRAGKDRKLLYCLYDLLEEIHNSSIGIQKEAFTFAFMMAMQRLPHTATALSHISMNETAYSLHQKLNVLLERSYEEQAAVAILGGILKMMYKEASIVVHPANESGASSLEVGDIDIIFSNDRCYAVEVKDKAFSETDVDHAAKKVLGKGRSRLIFACGYHGDISCIDIPGMIDKWRHNGVELSFVSIPLLFHQNLSSFGAEECHQYLNHVWSILITMRAKDEAVQDFMALLSLEGQ